MFSCCYKRQGNDDDEYRQRPKTRNRLNANLQTHAAISIPAKAVGSKEPVKSLEQMQNECLQAHNVYREKHGVGPLILNAKLNSHATDWAQHLAKNNILQHRPNNKYGENLYLGTNVGPQTHKLAVQAWYEEIAYYNFNKPGFSPNNGHFTQVIWKNSTELGVGIATSCNRTWVVCNYNPPGNIMGNYMRCVPPLIEETVSKIIDKMKQPNKKPKTKTTDESAPVSAVQSVNDLQLWSKFQLECLNSHNKYRAIHGSPPMKLSKNLCDLALDWSETLASRGVMSHRPNNEFGENIYYAMNMEPTAAQCVKSWYDEIKNFNFLRPGFSMKTGHFTQVVWRDSIELGVGISKRNNMTFVVCNYSPAGNVENDYQIQVPRPGNMPTTSNNLKPGSTTNKPQSFEEECLDSHNNVRAIHGSPPLTLNKNLSFLANDWAQHLAKSNKVEPRPNNRFGENIFYDNRRDVKGQDPVEHWYNDIKDYNFHNPRYTAATGSFTQVIWKSSRQLGVGVAKNGPSTYIVCNYDPKGNIPNKFAENVLPVGRKTISFKTKHDVSSNLDEFTEQILKSHNIYRGKHGCPPLSLSQVLMEYCLNYANRLTDTNSLTDNANTETSTDISNYVVSSIVFQGDIPSANEIVSSWYNEIENYDFKKPGYNKMTAHFTQIIWKNTKYLGVGVSKRDQNSAVVLSYEPAGNIENQYTENVPPPAS